MSGDEHERGPTGDGGFDAPEPELAPQIVAMMGDPALWDGPGAELGDRIVAGVRSESSAVAPPAAGASGWVRPALAGAAAVVVFLVAGIVVLSALSGSTGTDRRSAELVPTGLVDDVEGSIEMTTFASGLRIDLDAPSLPRRAGDRFYEAWLRTADDLLIPVGTFHGGESVTLWAGVDMDRVVAFSITLEEAVDAGSVDHRSSGRVVLKVDLPAP